MKLFNSNPLSSKAAKMLLLTGITLSFMLGACSKNEEKPNAATEEEAMEMAVQAVGPESGGLVLQTNASLTLSLTNMNALNCGVKKDSTITKTGGSGDRTYSFSFSWSRLLTCSGTVPSKYEHTFSGNSTYTTPKMSSDDKSSGSFVVTGLEPVNTEITLNQTYERSGTQQSKVKDMKSFTSKVNIQTTNVKINKITRQVLSGAGVINISGTSSTGGTFNYTGTIVFNGGNKATININGGSAHTIQW